MEGYIKDYRQELGSDVWLMGPIYHRVWQYLKYSANHSEGRIPMRDGTFVLLEPGQLLSSYRAIAEQVGWYERGIFKTPNVKTVKEVCDWLQKQEMIKIQHGKSNREYTLITLVNWGKYQDKEYMKVTEDKQTINSEETESKQSADINNNDNNNNIYINNTCDTSAEKPKVGGAQSKTGKGEYTKEFEEFWSHYPRRIEKKKAFNAWNARIKQGAIPKDMIFAAINYSKCCEVNVTEEKFIKHPSTFLGKDEPFREYIDLFLLDKYKKPQQATSVKENQTTVSNAGAYVAIE